MYNYTLYRYIIHDVSQLTTILCTITSIIQYISRITDFSAIKNNTKMDYKHG